MYCGSSLAFSLCSILTTDDEEAELQLELDKSSSEPQSEPLSEVVSDAEDDIELHEELASFLISIRSLFRWPRVVIPS